MSFGSRTRTRSVTSVPMRSVLGGSVFGGDDLDGGGGAGARVLSLSLSLCTSSEMV